jgi:hypothetical protein
VPDSAPFSSCPFRYAVAEQQDGSSSRSSDCGRRIPRRGRDGPSRARVSATVGGPGRANPPSWAICPYQENPSPPVSPRIGLANWASEGCTHVGSPAGEGGEPSRVDVGSRVPMAGRAVPPIRVPSSPPWPFAAANVTDPC